MKDEELQKLLKRAPFHAPGRPYMSRHDRAAQFMPFKSLNEYHDQVSQKEKELLEEDERIIWEDY